MLILLAMLVTIVSPAFAQEVPPDTGDPASASRLYLPLVSGSASTDQLTVPAFPYDDSPDDTPPAPAAPDVSSAAPANATQLEKVPHYFGPYPNWANSPFTLPDVTITITGDGAGATAVASVGLNGVLTSINLTNPGSGYTQATVEINGAGVGATATATVADSGAVIGVNVIAAGGGYTAPTVAFAGGGGSGTLVMVGNQLSARQYATDYASAPGTLAPVLVVVPTVMPASGRVQSIQYFNQATPGSSPTPSAGNLFHAYVLQATGIPNEYVVLWDSGQQIVPPTTHQTGVIETLAVPNIAVTTGDVIAFYGEGIPLDAAGGTDILSYPAATPPVQGSTITVAASNPTYPVYSQSRTYSFAAGVIDASGVLPLTPATATAYGGVGAINLTAGGNGYTFPTVDIDYPNSPDGIQATAHTDFNPATGGITAVVVDNPGSGYTSVPNVVIRDGTIFDPIIGGSGALAAASLKITSITVDTPGDGYVSAPTVTINDPTGTGATATAQVNAGAVTALNLIDPGAGYLTQGGIKKFTDALPGLCMPPACPASGKYIPLGVPEGKTYNGIAADEYVIGLVQYRTNFSSSLPDTLVRGYVQLETAANAGISQHFPLMSANLNPAIAGAPVLINGVQAFALTPPQFHGPTISATKDKPVRIVFHNLLPSGAAGDLFLPTDSTMMGSGTGPMAMADAVNQESVLDTVRNPACGEYPKSANCFKDNRATLHLHGGVTPWISDGTPHQWITPAGENTLYPQGVSVGNVPDMNVCAANDDGCQTFYYTNQQSARLMFYHDHAWGITRLNVYAGEAAGYLIGDDTEKALIKSGTIPGAADTIPLVVQDRTFVPDAPQLAAQDPTWDTSRWGGYGNFWYHHVYMPAQNPGDPSGMSAYGRWMYGPWFWPPAADTVYGPIANPYYNMDPATNFTTPLATPCNLDDPATWQYQTDPFCEPAQIPGTPNISAGMEQFNDTPIVNGVAYPTLTLEPKTYRLRILSAANDRFFNFQWYVGDPTTANPETGATEVALDPVALAAAQTDPNVFPTPIQSAATTGPDWIQIGTEGGFLPAPVVVDGQQPTTWIVDPTRFDVGNVDQHSLLLAPAERADVIVDFSRFAGKTLILYNDAPAAFPARVPSYDYYTGAPDLSPAGAPTILPGYGPNTRTIMQVKIAANAAAPAFNLTKLQTAFRHNAKGTGVFESGQPPIIVGQDAYNLAYGTSFAGSSNCNTPGSTLTRCDGFVRVNDTMAFGFNTLRAPNAKMVMQLQPKAIHDEMNSTTFDEFGRMQANLGVEAQPPTPGVQNATLYPYMNPATEMIDATNLPKVDVTYGENGMAESDIKITPILNAADGTQIWRVTHNGVDTHPIHFHLYDVQLLNRVTWDNIIIPPDQTELGWKDTVRIAPLEDTIVALRPIIPELPFELPNAIRTLNPMMPVGSTMGFNSVNAQGIPTAPIVNQLVNFGWEYVYHCHILSHEEMDMMRPVSVAVPPFKPTGLAAAPGSVPGGALVMSLSWSDNSIAETSYLVQRMTNGNVTWDTLGKLLSPLDQVNTTGVRTFEDATVQPNTSYQYRVVALNEVGYGGEFMSLTVQSTSDPVTVTVTAPPAAPTNLVASLQTATQVYLAWTDNAINETDYRIERATVTGGVLGSFAAIATLAANAITHVDGSLAPATTYSYRVFAVNAAVDSLPSNVATVTTPAALPVPAVPTNLAATIQSTTQIRLTWRDNATNETGFVVERSDNGGAFTQIAAPGRRNNTGTVTYNDNTVTAGNTYAYRVTAVNAGGPSAYSNTVTVSFQIPVAPATLGAVAVVANANNARVTLTWTDSSSNESGFRIQRATNATFTAGLNTKTVGSNTTTRVETRNRNQNYFYRIQAYNALGASAWMNASPFPIHTP